MVAVVVGMLFCVGLAVAVMALVAVPARRAGRDVLTERGEDVFGSIRDSRLTPGRGAEGGSTESTDPTDAAGAADDTPERTRTPEVVGARA